MPDTARHRFDVTGRRLTRRDSPRIGRDMAACIALGALPIVWRAAGIGLIRGEPSDLCDLRDLWLKPTDPICEICDICG